MTQELLEIELVFYVWAMGIMAEFHENVVSSILVFDSYFFLYGLELNYC